MKKIKGKHIKFIISLISVGVFVYSYFVIYNSYVDRTSDAYQEVESIKVKMLEREKNLAQEEEIQVALEEVNTQKNEILDSYPVYIAKEDNFMFTERLLDNLHISISSLNISDNKEFYKTILPAVSSNLDKENTEASTDIVDEDKSAEVSEIITMNGIVNTISMNFLTSYKGFKELSEYIKNYPEPTVIDNVSVSYDSSTGALAGNLTIKRFALTGTGKEYKSIHIDGINIGTDNLFGTNGVSGQDNVDINDSEDN